MGGGGGTSVPKRIDDRVKDVRIWSIYNTAVGDRECSICLESLLFLYTDTTVLSVDLLILPCGHLFHEACGRHLNNECPLCRHVIHVTESPSRSILCHIYVKRGTSVDNITTFLTSLQTSLYKTRMYENDQCMDIMFV